MGEMSEMGDGCPEWEAIAKMTSQELREDLEGQGLDPDAEVAAMRRLGRVMAAKYAPQVQRERLMPPAATKRLPVRADAIAAGRPEWASGQAAESQASLWDVLAGGTALDMAWARVSGWSMRDEGINDGDMILVSSKREPRDGDIVLAHLAGQGQVVKRLRSQGGRVSLLSAHPDFPPIDIDEGSALTIHGVVVGRAGKL